MSRYKNTLYTIERRVWRNHELHLIQNEDFTLFSGHHRTKILEEDLPEWYVFGRYYKMWGFLSTKGITDLKYIPNLWINHFLKDDCLLISYGGRIEEKANSSDFDKYSGVDERVWGNEILHILKGAEKFSQTLQSDERLPLSGSGGICREQDRFPPFLCGSERVQHRRSRKRLAQTW